MKQLICIVSVIATACCLISCDSDTSILTPEDASVRFEFGGETIKHDQVDVTYRDSTLTFSSRNSNIPAGASAALKATITGTGYYEIEDQSGNFFCVTSNGVSYCTKAGFILELNVDGFNTNSNEIWGTFSGELEANNSSATRQIEGGEFSLSY
jgi:hypothetical protein